MASLLAASLPHGNPYKDVIKIFAKHKIHYQASHNIEELIGFLSTVEEKKRKSGGIRAKKEASRRERCYSLQKFIRTSVASLGKDFSVEDEGDVSILQASFVAALVPYGAPCSAVFQVMLKHSINFSIGSSIEKLTDFMTKVMEEERISQFTAMPPQEELSHREMPLSAQEIAGFSQIDGIIDSKEDLKLNIFQLLSAPGAGVESMFQAQSNILSSVGLLDPETAPAMPPSGLSMIDTLLERRNGTIPRLEPCVDFGSDFTQIRVKAEVDDFTFPQNPSLLPINSLFTDLSSVANLIKQEHTKYVAGSQFSLANNYFGGDFKNEDEANGVKFSGEHSFCVMSEDVKEEISLGESSIGAIYPCQVKECPSSFPAEGLLLAHLMAHPESTTFACALCPHSKFANVSTLENHYKLMHIIRLHPLWCYVCGEQFVYRHLLVSHFRENHLERRHYACSICSLRFKNTNALVKHRLNEHERVNWCLVCDKKYITRKALRLHEQKMHSENGRPRVSCDLCHKTYSSQITLRNHRVFAHSEEGRNRSTCSLCKKTFATPAVLRTHQRNQHKNVD